MVVTANTTKYTIENDFTKKEPFKFATCCRQARRMSFTQRATFVSFAVRGSSA